MELGNVNLTDFLFETEMLLEIEMLYFISTVLICTTLICTILKAKKYAVKNISIQIYCFPDESQLSAFSFLSGTTKFVSL